jgi:hypothetical protein
MAWPSTEAIANKKYQHNDLVCRDMEDLSYALALYRGHNFFAFHGPVRNADLTKAHISLLSEFEIRKLLCSYIVYNYCSCEATRANLNEADDEFIVIFICILHKLPEDLFLQPF